MLNVVAPNLVNVIIFLIFLKDVVEIREVADIPSTIKVSMKLQYVGEYPIGEVITQYQRYGSRVDKPQDAVNALNIILGQPSNRTVYIRHL
jgi:hypothetical protein